MATDTDRITGISIRGFRTLADIDLDLDGLTVLVGENGSGKSTVIEALEILRRASSPGFMGELHQIHGGWRSLGRWGETEMRFEVRMVLDSVPASYSFTLAADDCRIVREDLKVGHGSRPIINRDEFATGFMGSRAAFIGRDHNDANLVISSFGLHPPEPEIKRTLDLLGKINVHVPFNVQSHWGGRAVNTQSQLRQSCYIQPASKLDLFGSNLPLAWSALRNDFGEDHWQATLDQVRIGLGDDVETIAFQPDPGGGSISLTLKFRNIDRPVPASLLSDGELAFLALVALVRLGGNASLVAFDEPDLHLHPALLFRIAGLFEELGEKIPVVLTTHSDRLLDALSDPAASVRVCEKDEQQRTNILKLDRAELEKWLERYSGFGDLRSNGYDSLVMDRNRGR